MRLFEKAGALWRGREIEGRRSNGYPEAQPVEYDPNHVRQNSALFFKANELANFVILEEQRLRTAAKEPKFRGVKITPMAAVRDSILNENITIVGESPNANAARKLLLEPSGRQSLCFVVAELVDARRAKMATEPAQSPPKEATPTVENTVNMVVANLTTLISAKPLDERSKALDDAIKMLQQGKAGWKNLPVNIHQNRHMTPDMFDAVITGLNIEFGQIKD